MFDEIIIIDETTGQSFGFQATSSGYAAAYAKIREIVDKGHRVGGDVNRVTYVMGPI